MVEGLDPNLETPLYQQLADLLRGMIESGEIPPRYPIPSKAQIRGRWGVSGQTVDRATQILKDEGLVRWSRGKGLYSVPPEERG